MVSKPPAGRARPEGPVLDGQPSELAADFWRLTVEHSPVGTCLVALDGTMVSPNPAFAEMLGYTTEQLRLMTFRQITHPGDVRADDDLLRETLSGARSAYRLTKRFVTASGEVKWGDLSAVLVRADDGRARHFISQVLDVTDQHDDHERLTRATAAAELERRLSQAVMDSVDVGLVLLDRHGRFERVNRHQQAILELAYPGGHDGRPGQTGEIYAADGTTRLTARELPCARAARGEEFDDHRVWVGATPVSRRALAVSARSVSDEEGRHVGAALAYGDITDLVEALQARDVFVASVSHELRTPLTVVLGYLELLLDVEDLSDDVTRQLHAVARSAVRLRSLVSDLLEPATGAVGGGVRSEIQLTCMSTDLAVLTHDVVGALLPMALDAEVTVATDQRGPTRVVLDPHRTRQVVENLVSNAVKYTDPGGRVDVRLEVEDGTARLSVCDTGIGIAPEDVAQLFTPFFRSDLARRRVAPGLGLGLGIARAIVLAHGGALDVTSEPGRGSCFRATFPVAGPPRGEQATVVATRGKVDR